MLTIRKVYKADELKRFKELEGKYHFRGRRRERRSRGGRPDKRSGATGRRRSATRDVTARIARTSARGGATAT